jgi:hypothetical protein
MKLFKFTPNQHLKSFLFWERKMLVYHEDEDIARGDHHAERHTKTYHTRFPHCTSNGNRDRRRLCSSDI